MSPLADVAALSCLCKPPARARAGDAQGPIHEPMSPENRGRRSSQASRGVSAPRTSTELKWRSPKRTEKNVDSPLCSTSTVPCASLSPGADVGAAKRPGAYADVARVPAQMWPHRTIRCWTVLLCQSSEQGATKPPHSKTNKQEHEQANKQTSQQTNKSTSKQGSKQTNKQVNNRLIDHTHPN